MQALDSTAAVAIAEFKRKARRAGAAIYITGASRPMRRALIMHGVRRVRFKPDVQTAVAAARAAIAAGARTAA